MHQLNCEIFVELLPRRHVTSKGAHRYGVQMVPQISFFYRTRILEDVAELLSTSSTGFWCIIRTALAAALLVRPAVFGRAIGGNTPAGA